MGILKSTINLWMDLLKHDNDDIFMRALRILKRFWPENDLEDILDIKTAG